MKNKNPKIAIINTGASNLRSVKYACDINNLDSSVVDENENIENYQGLIVPGVGNFGYVMNRLKSNYLDKFILNFIGSSKPAIFICLGMQLLFERSEEKKGINGLKIISGEVKKIKNGNKILKIPVIGWNKINIKKKSDFFKNVNKEDFYFVHSYYVLPKNEEIVHSSTNYNGFNYCSSIDYENIFACQFHPEKSGSAGLEIYKNFYEKNIKK